MKKTKIKHTMNDYNIKNLTSDEFDIIIDFSEDADYIEMIDKFKANNPTKFEAEINRLKKPIPKSRNSYSSVSKYTPKCPVCGSPDVVKISMTQKLLGVGTLGLASNSIGKSMKCKNCGYKF